MTIQKHYYPSSWYYISILNFGMESDKSRTSNQPLQVDYHYYLLKNSFDYSIVFTAWKCTYRIIVFFPREALNPSENGITL